MGNACEINKARTKERTCKVRCARIRDAEYSEKSHL